jgi:hypothetical protein
LRKNETIKKKNKKAGKECFQSAPPGQTALLEKIFRNRQPLYRQDSGRDFNARLADTWITSETSLAL